MTEEEKAQRMKWWEYWPVGVWLGLTVASVGTVLTIKAIFEIRSGHGSFWFWLWVIAAWATSQLVYELWFSRWIERNFLRKEQREVFYQKIRTSVELFIAWMEREFDKLYHAKINGAGYLKIFAIGVSPRIPKLPLAFVCWGKRSLSAFVVLAAANVLRIVFELKLGLKAVETVGVSGVLFAVTVVFAWMFFRKKAMRN